MELDNIITRRRSRIEPGLGFTLLELLIVVVIIALGMALVVAKLAPGGESAYREATRLAAILEYAGTRARTTGLPLAFQLNEGGYRFQELSEQWREVGMGTSEPLRPRKLPADINLRQVGAGPTREDSPQLPTIVLPVAGLATRFTLRLASSTAVYDLNGDVGGRVTITSHPAP